MDNNATAPTCFIVRTLARRGFRGQLAKHRVVWVPSSVAATQAEADALAARVNFATREGRDLKARGVLVEYE